MVPSRLKRLKITPSNNTPRREDYTGQAGQGPTQCVHTDDDAVYVQAHQPRCLFVVAHGIDVTAKPCVVENQPADDVSNNEHQDWYRQEPDSSTSQPTETS